MPGTVRGRSYLESQYGTGDRPSATDFADLFASFVSTNDADESPSVLGAKRFAGSVLITGSLILGGAASIAGSLLINGAIDHTAGSVKLSGCSLRVTTKGNLLVGVATEPTTGSPVMIFAQQTPTDTDPTGLPSNTAGLYAKNVTATAELFTIDEAGNVTQQTPHSFTLFTPHPSYEFPYVYRSSNAHLGLQVEVDMWGAIRALERLSGQKFIYLEQIDVVPWTSEKEMPDWLKYRVSRRDGLRQIRGQTPIPTLSKSSRPTYNFWHQPDKWIEQQVKDWLHWAYWKWTDIALEYGNAK